MQQEMIVQPDSPASRLSCLVSQFCNLRVLLKENAVTDQSTVIAMILKIDTELGAWPMQLSKDWDYAIIDTPDRTEGLYGRLYQVYADFWHAAIWNNYRSAHILLHETLLDQLDHVNGSTSPLVFRPAILQMHRHRSHALISRLASEICASVPFHLTHPHPHPAPAGAVFFLLWPLLVAGATVDVPDALRLWVIDRLEYIGSTTGTALATSLVNVLRSAETPSPHNQSIDLNPRHYEDIDDENVAEAGDSKGWKHYLNSWTIYSRRSSQLSGETVCRQDGDLYKHRQ